MQFTFLGTTQGKSNPYFNTRREDPATLLLASRREFNNSLMHGRLPGALSIVACITPYNNAMGTKIRPAIAADVTKILDFIRALAVYEREPYAVTATEADLLRDGFGSNPIFYCLIAENDGVAAGFALYFFSYSTWLGRAGLYLEDLFVHPEFRGLGIGKALLQQIAVIAVEKGCPRLQWEVLDWNTPAIDFYRAMGAEFMDSWRNVRVTGEALNRLAAGTGAKAETSQ
jgi:GNAT superfamily N-acetyltransferase